MNPVILKNIDGKITEFILKWVSTPNKNLRERGVLVQKLLNIDNNFIIKDVKV